MRSAHPLSTKQQTGAAAGIAIIAAIAGYIAIFTGHPFWGLFIEIVAIISGLVGFAMAASPRVSGGIISIIAIVMGVFGVAFSIFGMVGVILF